MLKNLLRTLYSLIGLSAALAAPAAFGEGVSIHGIPGQAEVGYVEIQGVAAGEFNPKIWEQGKLHLLADVRSPMFTPKTSGRFRNVYAPSPVETTHGWRLFYGAWDGVPTGNDRIYSALTSDFLSFEDRHTVIEHGPFIHVCNVCAIPTDASGFEMVCTAYPDENGTNKPVFFRSPDGRTWNGSKQPHAASAADLVEVEGYTPYREADINGVNVLLKEGSDYRLYFSNFKDWGHIYRASGTDGKHFKFEGPVLDVPHMVNDVERIESGGEVYYLMGLHANGSELWYSLSRDGKKFDPEKPLASNLGERDRYIVAMGWVTRGRRVLGFMYGAGAVPELDRNRLFGRWLQRKVVFVAEDGTRYEPVASLGPDRQLFRIGADKKLRGRFEFYAEDGVTPLGDPTEGQIQSGSMFQLDPEIADSEMESLLDADLTKWEGELGGAPNGWSMVNDILTFSGHGPFLKLKGEDYGDFLLRIEYRLPPGGNSGIYIRQPSPLTAYLASEIQILDDKADIYKDIRPYQYAGSIYGVVPAAKDVIHPAGEWNAMEILCLGSRIRVRINGEVVADASTEEYEWLKGRPRRGRIALQNHGSTLEFRNVRFKRLD